MHETSRTGSSGANPSLTRPGSCAVLFAVAAFAVGCGTSEPSHDDGSSMPEGSSSAAPTPAAVPPESSSVPATGGPEPPTLAVTEGESGELPLTGPGEPATEPATMTPDTTTPAIEIDGRQLLVGGLPLFLRGVCWNPVPRGAQHPEGLDFAGFAEQDSVELAALGVNVVRTYEPLLDTVVLDRLAAAGIVVINSVYPWGGAPASVVVERVRAVQNHPAILMWAIGNEWNYNGLYVGLSQAEALARLNEVAALIKTQDPTHPIATIYGELPDADTLAAMPNVDVWGINAYRGISFGDLFEGWRALSGKPMFLSEYGADAYNAALPGYDAQSQALAVESLAREILSQSSATTPDGVALGGTLFEWADEWWKDAAGSLTEQDVGGVAPGGGPYPDGVFNEEWWGIVDIERGHRPAFDALQRVFSGLAGPPR
jgi:hypothetical protein